MYPSYLVFSSSQKLVGVQKKCVGLAKFGVGFYGFIYRHCIGHCESPLSIHCNIILLVVNTFPKGMYSRYIYSTHRGILVVFFFAHFT